MSSLKIDPRQEKFMYLLYQLGTGNLPRELAGELKTLLEEELANAKNQGGDFDNISRLDMLIERLDDYIAGRTDLVLHQVVNLANVT